MRRIIALLFCCLLSGCVGGTFGNHDDFEMFPLRSASDSEGKNLKRCLQTAHRAQDVHKRRTGHFARRTRELNIDGDCNGFLLAQQNTQSGYEIRAELREDETTVRWSVNEQGVIEEHLEGAEGGDSELVL